MSSWCCASSYFSSPLSLTLSGIYTVFDIIAVLDSSGYVLPKLRSVSLILSPAEAGTLSVMRALGV